MPDISELISAAKTASQQAYAPYSGFYVGAALSDRNGKLYRGCNVENSAYPIGCCAEQAAVAAMILDGGQKIQDIVIFSQKTNPCPPCGACRQIIHEHSDAHTRVHLINADDSISSYSVTDLLPHAFTVNHLDTRK